MSTKLLAWGDYCCYTGFANVMSNILRRLNDTEIDVVGINYNGNPDYDRQQFPGRVWPARTFIKGPQLYEDMYGRQKLVDLLRDNEYDVLFMLQDTFVVEKILPLILQLKEEYNKQFKIVYYFPMDAQPIASWIRNSVSLVDIPVAYSQFGYDCAVSADATLYDKLKIIPHGVDDTFFPILDKHQASEFRYFLTDGKTEDKFLMANINRNTPRKDIPRSLMVLKELIDRGEKVALYLHMSNKDIGGDLTPVAKQLGLEFGQDVFIPGDLDAIKGYSFEVLNFIYNCVDVVITTSLGEGWGLSITEAMATNTPVVAPDHSAISEILSKDRGIKVKAGNNPSMFRTIDEDTMILRPLTDVVDMADKIQNLIHNGFDTKPAFNWVNKHLDWDKLVKEEWQSILSKKEILVG